LIGIFLLVLTACGGDESSVDDGDESSVDDGKTYSFQIACINRTLLPCQVTEANFVKNVNERTNGRVIIEISSFPELGLAGPDTLRLVADGTLGLAEIYPGYVGGDLPILDIAALWGIAPDSDTYLELADQLYPDMKRIFKENTGGEVIYRHYYDNQFIFSKTPLAGLEDYKGKKIRQHSTVLGDMLAGLGADGQFVAFSEVYTALERGILDAGVTGGLPGHGQRWYEVSDYLVGPIAGSFVASYVTMNKERWEELPADLQAIIKEEGAKSEAVNLDLVKNKWAVEAVELNVENGMTHMPFTPEVSAKLREIALEKIIPNWVDRVGGTDTEAVRLFNRIAAPLLGVKINPDGSASETSGGSALVSEGLSFKFQYACINRTLDPCKLLAAPGGMVERIFERTNGQVEIEISSFPELGLGGPDTLRLVEDGTLGMVEIYSGYIGGDLPIVDVANLWGVIGDIDTNWKTIEAVQGSLHKIIEERSNGIVLGESYYGNNYYYAGKALRSPADLKGLKIRSHSTVLGDLISGMGAEPQFVAFSEVYTALERGILDAAVTCGPCGAGLRWFEVADYLNGPIVSIGVTYITVNKDRWDEIPADLQAIMKEEAMAHQAENRRLMEDVWDPAGITDNVAGGMEFVPFSQELKDALLQASIDVVIPNWVDRNGGPTSEGAKMFNDLVGPIVGVTIDSNGKAIRN
jgi:TRAP-type C4-dicarboxylate transport system substrate-binding protein